MHCVQQKLETQPNPTQMLRPHATSRQWPMQIAWQGQWELMEDSLVILHSGSDWPVSSQIKMTGNAFSDSTVTRWSGSGTTPTDA